MLALAAAVSVCCAIWSALVLFGFSGHVRIGLVGSVVAAVLLLGAILARGEDDPEPSPDPSGRRSAATISFNGALQILAIDPEASRVLGYSAREVVGKPLSLILPQTSRRDIDRLASNAANRSMRSSARGRDGHVFPAEVQIREVGDGAYLAVIRMDSAGAAPAGELGLPWREFFLAAPNPQVIVDEDGHIIRANRVFEDLFEYASAELQRTTYWDAFLTGQQADNAAEEFLRHSERSLLPDIEQVWITRTGNPICIRWHRTAVEDPSTRVRHFLLSAGANDLGRNAVRQLAARYAQGFRNHLTVVTGYSELLLSNLPAGNPNRSDVEEIHRAAAIASMLADDLAGEGQ